MTMERVTEHTDRGAAIVELQGLTTKVGTGTTAATNIAVTGIRTVDTLQSVIMFASGVPSDVTADASITSDGNIQLGTVDSSTNQLVVNYYVKPNK